MAAPSARPDEAGDARPLVIIEKRKGALRIVATDRAAARAGLGPGLALADARARIPDLAVAEADPMADAQLLERLALCCERYTPLVALDGPDGLILDITGCGHLFGGEEALRADLRRRLIRLGLGARASIAGTPDAARALARHSMHEVVPPGDERRLALPLPIAALDLEPETATALARAGLITLGHLADRPSAALSARFGEGLATKLRRVLGHEDVRITPLRPVPDCIVERHFMTPLIDAGALVHELRLLLLEAGRRLEARGAGGRAFEASFFRADGQARRITVETMRPSRDADAILRLYRERIEALADPLDPGFGFDALRLAVPVAEPFEVRTPDLAGGHQESEQEAELADLVDRLSARFGRERVLRFVAQDSHQPARAAAALPAQGNAAGSGKLPFVHWLRPEPGEPPLRPLQLFAPPQPIEALAEVPDGPPLRFRWRRVLHEIARAEGPERIAPEWWRDGSPGPTRDYYRLEDAAGRRFWVFRQGLYGEAADAPRWFMHGLFA